MHRSINGHYLCWQLLDGVALPRMGTVKQKGLEGLLFACKKSDFEVSVFPMVFNPCLTPAGHKALALMPVVVLYTVFKSCAGCWRFCKWILAI